MAMKGAPSTLHNAPLTLLQTPDTVQQAAEEFLRYCRARNLSRSTLNINREALKQLCRLYGELPPAALTPDHLRDFLLIVGGQCKPATVQRYYTVLRAFGKRLQDARGLTDPASKVERPKAPAPVIEPLSQQEVEALITACTDTPVGKRNRLILLMLVDCGLRASELTELKLEDVDMTERLLLVRCGKGGKPRLVPFGQTVEKALVEWLAVRSSIEDPHLLVNCYGQQIDRHRLRAIVVNCARRAGITRPVYPHRLRHTCAVFYLRAGGDVFTLQRILGHADLTMTRRYTQVADTDVQQKHRLFSPADRLNLPDRKRKRAF